MNPILHKSGIVIHRYDHGLAAWIHDGCTSWPLTADEKQLDPDALYQLILKEWANGKSYRCTSCGVSLPRHDVAGWPLFAGCCCASCWKAHQDHVEEERRLHHICSLCGKPYSLCYC